MFKDDSDELQLKLRMINGVISQLVAVKELLCDYADALRERDQLKERARQLEQMLRNEDSKTSTRGGW